MRKFFGVILVAVVTFSFAKGALAEPSSAIRSLTGVTAVRVVVEDFNAAMQQTGLQKEQLYALASETLNKNGIRVVQPGEVERVPLVYIRLSSVMGGEGDGAPVGLYLNMQVRQMAMLEKKGETPAKQPIAIAEEKPVLVSTWENGTMAMVGRQEIGFYVRTILTNLVADFAHDHKEANGAQPQS
ncbi:MAG: hypothetical protein HOP18_06935 [Deltaproteobacteria bacterium]|nr:hypothetical protein [Deltaproteobacteria bacterium]